MTLMFRDTESKSSITATVFTVIMDKGQPMHNGKCDNWENMWTSVTQCVSGQWIGDKQVPTLFIFNSIHTVNNALGVKMNI